MTIRNLPEMSAPRPRRPYSYDFTPEVLARWDAGVRFEVAGDNVVNVFGVIGEDFWSDSVTARQVERRLQEIGKRDVIVNINSPGGDFFEGQAIFNLLRLHPGEVTVRVLGVAASAASVVAMAGDRIEMPAASWLMIHNTWTIAVGDRHVLGEVIADLAKFDQVSAELYAARTGGDAKDIAKLMDSQTFIGGVEAVENGFADAVIDGVKATEAEDTPARNALRKMEGVLQRAGIARGERRSMIRELQAKPSAGPEAGKPGATESASFDAADVQAVRDLASKLRDVKV